MIFSCDSFVRVIGLNSRANKQGVTKYYISLANSKGVINNILVDIDGFIPSSIVLFQDEYTASFDRQERTFDGKNYITFNLISLEPVTSSKKV